MWKPRSLLSLILGLGTFALCSLSPRPVFAQWPVDSLSAIRVNTLETGTHLAVADGAGSVVVAYNYNSVSPGPTPATDPEDVVVRRLDAFAKFSWGTPPPLHPLLGTLGALVADGSGGAWVVADTIAGAGRRLRAAHVAANGGMGAAVPLGVPGVGARYCASAADGAGGIFVAYVSRDSLTAPEGVTVQHLDASGVRKWGASGAPLQSPGVDLEQSLQVASDGHGGAFVLWRRQPVSGSAPATMFAQHVLAAGLLAGAAEGTVVRSGVDIRDGFATLLADGVDRARVVWSEKDSASFSTLRVQRLDETAQPLWPFAGVVVNAPEQFSAKDKVCVLGAGSGDVIVGWVDFLSGMEVRAQRVHDDGTVLWAPGGVVAAKPPGVSLTDLVIAPDGADGAVLGYVDYVGTSVFSTVLMGECARVTAAGARAWPLTGFRFDAVHTPHALHATESLGGRVIFTWYDERFGAGLTTDNIWAQEVTSDGTFAGALASVEPGTGPGALSAWPQPAFGRVSMSLPVGARHVRVLDVAGRRVREWDVAEAATVTSWDARDDAGTRVAPGLYLARITSDAGTHVARVVIAR